MLYCQKTPVVIIECDIVLRTVVVHSCIKIT